MLTSEYYSLKVDKVKLPLVWLTCDQALIFFEVLKVAVDSTLLFFSPYMHVETNCLPHPLQLTAFQAEEKSPALQVNIWPTTVRDT